MLRAYAYIASTPQPYTGRTLRGSGPPSPAREPAPSAIAVATPLLPPALVASCRTLPIDCAWPFCPLYTPTHQLVCAFHCSIVKVTVCLPTDNVLISSKSNLPPSTSFPPEILRLDNPSEVPAINHWLHSLIPK